MVIFLVFIQIKIVGTMEIIDVTYVRMDIIYIFKDIVALYHNFVKKLIL